MKNKYDVNMIEYLERRRIERFDRKYGMIGAVIVSVLLAGFILALLMSAYNF